jgi:cytochrome c oxidase cbb3-type subunit III
MRLRQSLASLAVLLTSVFGGSLECQPNHLTQVESHGRELYGRMCSVCHGENGEGYKADKAPAIALPDYLASVSDSALRVAIASGRGATTMSAWGIERGGPLTRPDVEAVIAFMRTWYRGPHLQLDERPIRGDANNGATVFTNLCVGCHGEKGTAGQYVSIGNPELLVNATTGFLRHVLWVGRPGTPMPAFGTALGHEGIEDVIALLRTWQFGSPAPRVPPARPPPIPLGPVPLNPGGPDALGFRAQPAQTSCDTVKTELDRGARMAILDARAPSDYSYEHIAGAVSVPFYDPSPYFAALPKDSWLVCYCACPHAESGQLAKALLAAGFTKVTVLDEGLGVWKRKGYPVHQGLSP